MRNAIGNVAIGGVMVASVLGLAWAGMAGQDRQDKWQCNQWAAMAREASVFSITQSQADQCDYWHIEVNATVK